MEPGRTGTSRPPNSHGWDWCWDHGGGDDDDQRVRALGLEVVEVAGGNSPSMGSIAVGWNSGIGVGTVLPQRKHNGFL